MKKIDISPLLIAAVCVLAYCMPPRIVFPFLLAASIHEASHIIVCKLHHVELQSFSLGLGGAELNAAFRNDRQELICVAAGPLSNLLCVLLFFRAPCFALFSLLLGIYNLLPLSSLDGGRLLFLLLPCSFLSKEAVCTIVECIVILLLIVGCIVLCCKYHAGLWSVLGCACLLVRSDLLEKSLQILPRRRKIKKKRIEGIL